MSKVETIAIVGGGLAGAKAAEALRKDGFDGRVLLFGAEAHRPYIRPPLSKEYLRGEGELDKVFVHPEAWYAEQRVDLEPSTTVTAIDAASHEVVLDGGRRRGVRPAGHRDRIRADAARRPRWRPRRDPVPAHARRFGRPP